MDAHVHVFPPEMIRDREAYLERDDWFGLLYGSPSARMVTADEVVAQMDEAGVEMSVVFGFAFRDQGLCRLVNDYVIEAVTRAPRPAGRSGLRLARRSGSGRASWSAAWTPA